ncbi:MAG: hypothetical protein RL141_755 [Candidatus Parcubacteria bacterium]|jgi:FAD synthetase
MTVLVTGTFDGLHPGHEDLFRQAKALGDRLVVVVARDKTVQAVKHRMPRMGEVARLQAVAAHPLVDLAVLGKEGDKLQVITEIDPDILLLGYDQAVFTDALEERLAARGIAPRVLRAEPFQPERYKSSLLYESGENG